MENKGKIIKTIEFYTGLISLVITLFYIMNKSIRYSGGFDILIKNFNFTILLVILPIVISLILLFYYKKNIFCKILVILSGILLIAMLIICLVISYNKFKVIEYISFIIVLIVGSGLIILSFMDKFLLGEKKYVK